MSSLRHGVSSAAMMLLGIAPATAQTTLRGRVFAADLQPVAGAEIALRTDGGTQRLGATGPDGTYAITFGPVSHATALVVRARGLCAARMPLPAITPLTLLAWSQGELPPLVLEPGNRLIGRVRDADGRPLQGVEIEAAPAMQAEGYGMPQWSPYCDATTDRSGIFTLAGVAAQPARLQCHLDGYFSIALAPVGLGSPLEVTLRPSGFLRGVVQDQGGRGVAAQLLLEYEDRDEIQVGASGSDGSFALPWRWPGYCRLFAKQGEQGAALARTAVLLQPADDLRLQLVPFEQQPHLRVTATGDDGKPLQDFRAAVLWAGHSIPDEVLWSNLARAPAIARDGVARLAAPVDEELEGAVLVIANGRAQAIAEVTWQPPGQGVAMDLCVPTLPARTLRGTVIDGDGKPVPGAWVWARRVQQNDGWVVGDHFSAVHETSAADGSFALDYLDAGRWELHAWHPGRPAKKPRRLLVPATGEVKPVRFVLPAGVQVAGAIAAAHPGWQFGFAPLEDRELQYYTPMRPATTVGAGGSFALFGVPPGVQQPTLLLPLPVGTGGPLRLGLTATRIDHDGDEALALDAGFDLPGRIRGKLTFAAARPPLQRLLVQATAAADDRFFTSVYGPAGASAQTAVQPDGSFELPATKGRHRLRVIDCLTGIELGAAAEPFDVPPAAVATADLAIEVVEVRVELKGVEAGDEGPGIRLRYSPPSSEDNGGYVDGTVGMSLLDHGDQATLFVPPGDGELRLDRASLPPLPDTRLGPPPWHDLRGQVEAHGGDLAAEFTATPGKLTTVQVQVPRRLRLQARAK